MLATSHVGLFIRCIASLSYALAPTTQAGQLSPAPQKRFAAGLHTNDPWSLEANLASDHSSYWFGQSVSLSGGTALVSAQTPDGTVVVFELDANGQGLAGTPGADTSRPHP